MRILGLGGEPATGKTHLMRAWACKRGIDLAKRYKAGLMSWHQSQDGAVLLGDYRPEAGAFGGTDRLSYSVQRVAEELLQHWKLRGQVRELYYEGDRLFNTTFTAYCEQLVGQANCAWHVLEAGAEQLKKRHRHRGDTQTATWLKGRTTKVANMVANLTARGSRLYRWRHAEPADTETILDAWTKT